MKSTRLLTLIFLSLTFIKAFATLEEAKEALAKKNQEEKVKEDELLKAEIELVRLKSINYSLVKDKESIRQQQIALGSNEEEFKKRKEGKQTEFAERAEKCINLESQFLFTKKFQPILASSFISSPEILLLVKKRKQDFVDESEIDAVKSYLNAFQEIEKKYKDAYALVRSSKFHNEIYQSDKEKLGKDLIKLKDDLEKEINERKKQEIMDKIKELEVQIVSITQKITEIENKLPGLEKDLVAKEEEYNKMFNLFHWHKLMEEMTTIIEGRSYKEMNNINSSIRPQK